jgi:PAS domain S-box-containing protein
MNDQNKSKEELIKELQEQNFLLRKENNSLKAEYEKDISARKRAEEELAELNQLSKQIIQSAHEGIIVYDRDLKIRIFNPYMENLSGFPASEVIGKHAVDLFPFLDDFGVIENLKKVLTGEIVDVIDFPFSVPYSGQTGWSSYTTAALQNAGGEIIGVINTVRNITERKKAEEALANEKQRLADILKGTNVGSWEWNVQTGETIFNERWAEIIGYTLEEIAPLNIETWIKFTHPEDLKISGELLDKHFKGELDYYECEARMKHKNGNWVYVLDRGRVHEWDEEGKPLLMSGTHQDITEKKQTEIKLKISEAQKNAILNGIKSNIAFVDKDLKILWANKTAADSVNKTSEEMIGQTCHHFWANPEEPCKDCPSLKAVETKKSEEIIMHTPDGRVWEEKGEPIFDAEGNLIGVVEIATDVTERKKAEEALRGSEENLRKINAEKDKFFSIIAHDLRSPFNGFLGLTEIMAEGLQNLTLEEIQNIAVNMKISAANLYRLLENLLEWSLMKRGLTAFEPQLFLLSRIITESMALVTEAADKKEIAIKYDIPEDLTVFADRNMFEGIIRNLSSNAVKFTNKGGVVNISAKTMPDNMVEISVKDTGIGMGKDITDNLFRLDVNTSSKGTEDEPSTGLGLLICKDFIEKHGGELRVESEEGKGSVFTFTIPNNI